MKFLIAFSLLLTVVAAGVVNNGHGNNNHNSNGWNNNGNNDFNIDARDGNHQKFILELIRHLQQDVQRDEFIKYTTTIRLDNMGDYKVNRWSCLKNLHLLIKCLSLFH